MTSPRNADKDPRLSAPRGSVLHVALGCHLFTCPPEVDVTHFIRGIEDKHAFGSSDDAALALRCPPVVYILSERAPSDGSETWIDLRYIHPPPPLFLPLPPPLLISCFSKIKLNDIPQSGASWCPRLTCARSWSMILSIPYSPCSFSSSFFFPMFLIHILLSSSFLLPLPP